MRQIAGRKTVCIDGVHCHVIVPSLTVILPSGFYGYERTRAAILLPATKLDRHSTVTSCEFITSSMSHPWSESLLAKAHSCRPGCTCVLAPVARVLRHRGGIGWALWEARQPRASDPSRNKDTGPRECSRSAVLPFLCLLMAPSPAGGVSRTF